MNVLMELVIMEAFAKMALALSPANVHLVSSDLVARVTLTSVCLILAVHQELTAASS